MKSTAPLDRSRLEWLGVAIVAVLGAGLRLWPIGRLGLTHFDEGIYARIASWSLDPRGLSSLDPELISYAPPGYPILGGLAYSVIGRSDGAMIAVSQLAGIATIPVVAWLARRVFGPGAGFAAATFCAFSGPHIAFSRMALTDSSFLLAWLVALAMGVRFLERPGFFRAVAMGLAVGVAQEFKYNGWLAGAIVIGSAVLGVASRPEDRKPGSIGRVFGWGLVAAGVAWLVVWPWYDFVERHGGYSALLRHQRSYLGGFGSWWPNLHEQIDQAVALSGGPWLIVPSLVIAGLVLWIDGPAYRESSSGATRLLRFRILALLTLVILGSFFVASPDRLGLIAAPWLLLNASPAKRLVGVWWLVLAVTSPFYHAYARLWLSFHSANWVLLGWLVSDGFASVRAFTSRAEEPARSRRFRGRGAIALGLFVLGAVVHAPWVGKGIARAQPDLLAPSDSLYVATIQVSAFLPEEVRALQVHARPPVLFYGMARVPLGRMPDSEWLLRPGTPGVWALVDSAMVRSDRGASTSGPGRNLLDRYAKNWELVEEFPTTLSLPTMLDLDPGAARSGSADRSSPLWLLRPRRPGGPR